MSGLYTQSPATTERDTTIRDLLAVVFKRKWLILGIFGVVSVLTGIKVGTTPVRFTADATVLLNRKERGSVLQSSGSVAPWTEVIESEIEVVRSVPVLQRAVERLQLPTAEHPQGLRYSLDALSNLVKAGMIGESNVIYVTGTASTPSAAQAIANSVANAYIEYHKELFKLPDASRFIRHQADSTMTALERLQDEREQLFGQLGLTDVAQEQNNLIRMKSDLQAELATAEVRATRLRTELADVRRLGAGDESLPFYENTGSTQGQAVSNAAYAIRNKVAELNDLRTKYTATHPQVRTTEQELVRLREGLQTAIRDIVSVKEHELNVVSREVEELRRQVDGIETRLAALPKLMRDLDVLDTRIQSTKATFSALSEQASSTEVQSMSFQDYGVKMLSEAVGAQKTKKGDLVRIALGPLLALMAGIGLAFYLENLDHSLETREDVERHLEIPVLASFPNVDVTDANLDQKGKRLPFSGGKSG